MTMRLALAWRLTRRELRSGLSGFRIFFACLVLGVGAIAGIGSLSGALLGGLATQGRVLLGGDVSVGLVHRPATPAERAFLDRYGRLSETASMRAMAYALKHGREAGRQLIELKAVDANYPLYGSVALQPVGKLQSALACRGSVCGAVAEQTLLDRLHVHPGDMLRIGTQTFRIAAALESEPDRLSGGFSLGPHVLVSDEGLKRTGLVVLGSLIEYRYRVALSPPASISGFRSDAEQTFADAGWHIQDRNDAAPGLRRFVEQITMFLTLVGLTALAVGGVGAGQSISAFLGRKRGEIATLKALGADGSLTFLVFFLQVMSIAAVAVVAGLAIGAVVPFIVEHFYGADIPVPAQFGIYATPLLLAAAFGLLSAAAFSIPPLARAREIMPAHLFRDIVAPSRKRGRLPYLLAAGVAAAAVAGLALLFAPSALFTLYFLFGAAAGLALLRAMALALQWILRRLPRPPQPGLRLALANMTRPGGATSSVVTALGLGLTLLGAVTLLDRTISAQVEGRLPQSAPTFFFVDIQPYQTQAFDRVIRSFRSQTDYRRSPMIRGRVVAINGVPAKKLKVASNVRWVLNGDRGITYDANPPKASDITEGKWWPPGYRGPTLISFDGNLAAGLHVKLGDTITLNVLGREISGRVANFRNVDFSNGRQNFVFILSPGIIDRAPHDFLATVRVAPRDETAMYRAITDKFPNVSTIRVKDAIAQLNGLLQELADGIRAASLVTILAGLLVLAGAIAAAQRARLYDSTILKVLGATRATIAGVYAMEYGLMGLIGGALALGAATLVAWLVCHYVFEVALVFDWSAVLITVAGGSAAALVFGIVAAWPALSAKSSAILRKP